MIPSNILEPKGCGKSNKYCSKFNCDILCGESYDFKIIICDECKSSRKAVIKALIDEKKDAVKILDEWLYNITKSTNHSPQKLYDKIEELTQEINTLGGLE